MLCAGALCAPQAHATGLGPRTPVEWADDTPCMTVVDRTQGSALHFPYQLPREDTALDPEDMPGSRRQQFFAFCRDQPHEGLPSWVSSGDVDGWNDWAVGLGWPPVSPPLEDVLETSGDADCFARITPDDSRRRILFAEAHKGVDWDVAGLPPGPYTVRGYTWHPPYNIWSRRPGVVHVVDSPDLAAVPPAVALMNRETGMFADDGLVLTGCARAMVGSTLRGSWAPTEGPNALVWQPFVEGLSLTGEVIALPFMPPPEAVSREVYLRIDVTDPLGRTFSAYSLDRLSILPGSAACDPQCTGGDGSPTTSDDPAEPTTSSSSGAPESGSTAQSDEFGASGCGCRSAGAPTACLLLLFARRRRRGR